MTYPNVQLFIDGAWRSGGSGEVIDVVNPATEEIIGKVASATAEDLDAALEAAQAGFQDWSAVSAHARSAILRDAAQILRDRVNRISEILTLEQGKPLRQAKLEVLAGAEMIEWCAEEARRSYGMVIPARSPGVLQMTLREPVGPVAAFAPWNFPINQCVRKLAAGLAAGCSFVLKGPEDTPGSPAELVRAFVDAGVPANTINLVYGDPPKISGHLIPHPVIRKVSFTGSTQVGRQIGALAANHMKRITMELGGHAPVIVTEEADLDAAVNLMVQQKFRNAGQVCTSPTRFIVQERIFDRYVEKFVDQSTALVVGDGFDAATEMGPLINQRRVDTVSELVDEAVALGAILQTGGARIAGKGYFYAPTVLTEVPITARIQNEEPFGPVALINPYRTLDDALTEANRLDYRLASYAFAKSAATIGLLRQGIAAGMLAVNHLGLALPELPFGGVRDSGVGTEGGAEVVAQFLDTKIVTQMEKEG
ncbi:NAD-dependent succinate-semialdehyde dehydrogenase [Marinovum sp. SP66]|uniref:NAD-dependent succinate-semialdehyde dehydrogenase n=1 Tax=Marinovum sp. SP66 TaxID=3028379 RepID=UPI00237B5D31|nr:NAD-dependent succinate-semialdehyde dehydrogenase [Marinovum sp. SP66]MDD9739804.1 NAD-dependent succinate-semialdehyde dehydrogenase [Marinovum sp. SP66]